jgi:hypothetical protein
MDPAQILDWYAHRTQELKDDLRTKGGIPRHDSWRLNYYLSPYLLLESYDELRLRHLDLFYCLCGLNEDGKISPDDISRPENEFLWESWTHVVEAWNSRGGLPGELVEEVRQNVLRYFENGEPRGVAALAGMNRRSSNTIVKFSRVEFL